MCDDDCAPAADDDDRDGFLSLEVVHCYFDNEPIQFIYDHTPPVCVQLSRNFIVKIMVASRRQQLFMMYICIYLANKVAE